jgi:hypothetical protein
VGFAPFAQGLVVGLGPGAGLPAVVRPQVYGGPQGFVAGPAQPHFMHRAGLVANRGGAGVTLEGLGRLKLLAIVAQFGQESRRQFGTGSRQRAEQVMVGVLGKEFLDLPAVVVQLRLQHPQLFGARHGQAALGLREGVRTAKLQGFGEKLQPFLVGFGPGQLVGVQEFFESGVCRRGPGPGGSGRLPRRPRPPQASNRQTPPGPWGNIPAGRR